jgi:hypothetical protein
MRGRSLSCLSFLKLTDLPLCPCEVLSTSVSRAAIYIPCKRWLGR